MTKCVVLLLILSILHGSSPLGLPLTFAGCCSPSSSSSLSASAASTSSDTNNNNDQQQEENLHQLEQNSKYIMGLISNLEVVLDKWIITGRSPDFELSFCRGFIVVKAKELTQLNHSLIHSQVAWPHVDVHTTYYNRYIDYH